MTVLVVNGQHVRTATLAVSAGSRRRGLLGIDEFDGLLVIPRCRQVHTIGMRFPIDVAFCDRDGTVLHVATGMRPGRISRIVWRSRFVVEAAAGAFAEWPLVAGDHMELRESAR